MTRIDVYQDCNCFYDVLFDESLASQMAEWQQATRDISSSHSESLSQSLSQVVTLSITTLLLMKSPKLPRENTLKGCFTESWWGAENLTRKATRPYFRDGARSALEIPLRFSTDPLHHPLLTSPGSAHNIFLSPL